MEEDGAALDAGPELLHLCEVRDQDPWSSSRSNAVDPEQTEHAEEPSVHAESDPGVGLKREQDREDQGHHRRAEWYSDANQE